MMLLRCLLPLLLALSLAFTAVRQAVDTPCEFDGIERIVAIGDVHGAYDRLVEILKVASILDKRDRWAGGRAHLIQLGDVVDRGPDSRKAIDLYRRLEREAASAGGRVHYLLGNHEAMRILADYRYLVPGEIKAFVTGASEDIRRQVIDTMPAEQRERLMRETPVGMIELIQAFGPKGQYGSYLRTLNAVVRVNGIVFLHGGISPAIAPMRCAAINETVRRELTTDLEKTRAEPQTSVTTREDGPLWYRGLAQEPDAFKPQVDEILTAQDARAIVVAHTVQPTGRIQVRFDNKVILMDTGMQPAYVPDGRASALEIRGGVFTAIYVDRRDVLFGARSGQTAAPRGDR